MSVLDRSAEQAQPDIDQQSAHGTAQKVLLACGILAALLYAVAHDALAALLYSGDSPFSQTISELSSIGVPTRPTVTGVWRSARGNRALRVTG